MAAFPLTETSKFMLFWFFYAGGFALLQDLQKNFKTINRKAKKR